jgi:hypothetical protein
MNLQEKREFIHSLIETVEQGIMDKTGKMPENWGATELRHYIKDQFGGVVWQSFKRKPKNFNNDCLVNNL